jgi:maltose alpha-D-glucosyltransferase/alpha-amylase
VLAHRADWAGGAVVALHNLAADGCVARLDLGGAAVEELLADRGAAPLGRDGAVPLGPYGWRWLRLHGTGGGPA